MSTVKEIESAIIKLKPKEIDRVEAWIAEHKARLWDAKMEADAKAGKFRKLKARVQKAKAAGQLRPMP